jgi:hypothetical protein
VRTTKRLLALCVAFLLLVTLFVSGVGVVLAAPIPSISGLPLQIDVTSPVGSLSVYRYQVLDGQYVRQYFSTFESYLRLGEDVYSGSPQEFDSFGPSTGFIPISMTQVSPWTIETTVDAGESGVRILQTISYVNGNPYYTKTWRISNLGGTTYTDVGFLHGGDTYFGGDDNSMGHWEPSLGMVYLTNPDPEIAGIMGFYGDRTSPASHYYEAGYGPVWAALESGHLPDSVRSDFIDAGYGLEWDRSTLAPGDVWTITSYEKWTEAGFVQVFAPQEESAPIGTKVTLPFVVTTFGQAQMPNAQLSFVQSRELAPVIVDLAVESSMGWQATLPQGYSLTLFPGVAATVDVEVSVPWTAQAGDRNTITLTASSRGEEASTGSDSTVVEAEASRAADVIPPTIILPMVEPVVNHSAMALTLDVRDDSGQAKVSILDNGTVLVDPFQNGILTYYLDLFEGENNLEVIAVDGAQNTTRARFTVIVDTHAPEIVLDTVPLTVSSSSITLSGTVGDRTTGVRRLSVNGVVVDPYVNGRFSQVVQLKRGANTVDLETVDAAGNIGHYAVHVIYAAPIVQGSMTIDLTVGKTGMIVNGMARETDSAPVIRNGRTLLPVRSLIEALGGSVAWNGTTRTTTVALGGKTVQLVVGSSRAVVDGAQVAIDSMNSAVVPEIINGRTYLPLRFLADSLGISVAWDAAAQAVSLTYWP